MTGNTRVSVPITSWPGKPTSGRFVYPGRESGVWYWQCDLHSEDPVPDDQWGMTDTWVEAMAGALTHAAVCPFVAVPAGGSHDQ